MDRRLELLNLASNPSLFPQIKILRAKNLKLERENHQMNVTLQTTVAALQKQMTEALAIALNKKIEVEEKLSEAEATIVDLRNQLAGDQIIGEI